MGREEYPILEPALNHTRIILASKPLFERERFGYNFLMMRFFLYLSCVLSLAACSHSRSERENRSPSPLDAPYRRAPESTVSVSMIDEVPEDADMPQGDELYRMFPVAPAAAGFRGQPATLKLETASSHARQYAKELAAAAAKGPNFAGNVTLATVDCGEGCKEIFILSPKTGKVLPNTLAANGGAEFRRDSTLLVLNPKASKRKMLMWDAKGGFLPVEDPAKIEAPKGLEDDGAAVDTKND